MNKEFTYKLDFYYQQVLIYLITFVLYIGIKGNFIDKDFRVTFQDPIIYIIIFFVLISIVGLILNKWRRRKLILTDKSIIFSSRFKQTEININDVEWIYIGRERGVKTAGLHQMVLIKTVNRVRAYRLRVGRYEREKILLEQFKHLSDLVPTRKKRSIINYTKELTRRKK